jgi:branched-chain amino acid transport system permease protein
MGARVFNSLKLPVLAFIAMALFGLLVDFTANDYVKLILLFVCINIIFALGLNLVNGFTGQFSIGHAGFMAIGAYTSAFLSTRPEIASVHLSFFPPALDFLNYMIFAICGGSLAALAGYFVGLPSLRLRGDYLAIVTLGFGEIIRVMLLNTQTLGGARGMYGIPTMMGTTIAGFKITKFYEGFLFSSFWVVISFVVLWRMVHSIHGRTFLSIREDEIAAEAMGVDTTSVKVRAFVISSFFAGIAGALFAQATQYLNPSTFSFTKSVDAIIMIVLGGMGSLTGSVFAAVIITVVPEFMLRPIKELSLDLWEHGMAEHWNSGLLTVIRFFADTDLRLVIYALALILFMIVRPQGIFGTREWPDLVAYIRSRLGNGGRKKHGAA